ncbi:M48 family metalloprotease, partial [Candidatus Daviesbacteria bacterium]|nr:M48 family metalloprotease [Candidatus Daviesbacteria bacterium]
MATVNTAWDHRGSNIFKTWLIMFFFSLFAVAVVYIISLGLIIAGVMNFVSYFYSDKIVLGLSGAKPIKKQDNPELFRTVENLCIAAGLPTPKVYIINDSAPNAFATGRDPKHAAIAFTSGILEKLNKQELEGVTAHELSHVGNRDTLVMAVVAILAGMIAILSDFFLRSLWFGRSRDRGGGLYMVLAIA